MKKGLRSAARPMAVASLAGGRHPAYPVISLATAAGPSAPAVTNSASRWRRRSSSALAQALPVPSSTSRAVTRTSNAVRSWCRARCSSIARVARSAQCRSSSTSKSGLALLISASSDATAASRWKRSSSRLPAGREERREPPLAAAPLAGT